MSRIPADHDLNDRAEKSPVATTSGDDMQAADAAPHASRAGLKAEDASAALPAAAARANPSEGSADQPAASEGEPSTASEQVGERELTAEERQALRENAKRVLRESGAAEILQTLNKHALQGRGRFEEYDSGVVFKWGTGFTTRHIWVHVSGDRLQFRLKPHLKCSAPIPECDGEYHTFTAATWRIPNAVLREVDHNYKRPVAESSSD